ncbi:MAG: nuclear transport factor 2 family protein [Gammaproteobacteria bacterium]|nr:nuclear transport factor 2 family protein [Gammaproteobacteria bacterium]
MGFQTLLTKLIEAITRGDGRAARACFTADGVYHDCLYGAFQADAIATMVEQYFHRDATKFIWDTHDPVCDGRIGYARYVFSFESKLPESLGKRAGFEGVSICELVDGQFASYREVANSLPGLQALGFVPERLARLAGREAAAFFARPEAAHHRGAA